MAAKKSRPVVRYHGGKWRLAPWIIEHFPEHRIYVEPFGGGGSVLMRKPRSYAEVYNDRWSDIVNVFEVLRDHGPRLAELLHLTPFARDEFVEASVPTSDPLECARRTIFRSMAGFGSAAVNSKYATGFRANSNRSGTSPAHDWANFPSYVEQFTERLRGVVIENREAIDVIRHHDTAQTLHYIDPPYVHATRNMRRGNAAYHCELTDEDHVTLADEINKVDGMVVLSGYKSGLYDDLYSDWHQVEKAAYADGAKKRIEVLWLNDAAAEKCTQTKLAI